MTKKRYAWSWSDVPGSPRGRGEDSLDGLLIRHRGMSDTQMAAMTGVSRNTVSAHRKRLERQGALPAPADGKRHSVRDHDATILQLTAEGFRPGYIGKRIGYDRSMVVKRLQALQAVQSAQS